MSQPLALIVDDEPDICELLLITLRQMKIDAHTANNLAEARALLGIHHFDFCLTDLRLPDGDGIELVRDIQRDHPKLPTAVITAYGSMELAINALKAGAFDFVSKPVDLQSLRGLVSTALRLGRTTTSSHNADLVGDSKAMQQLRRMIIKLARSEAPVYISGESGTGKDLVAELLHANGPRADGPFVPINCGAIPGELLESELFGHKRGSFTGAHRDKLGLFQAANGGTLLLDEIAELPMAMQVKLLRAIQERAIRSVGAEHEVPIDVRILSATHKDLAEQVRLGLFREDLYYRINVIELPVPALRHHPEDIPALAAHLISKLSRGQPAPELTEGALKPLRDYPFPGNVRELENILERAIALCEDERILPEDLQLPSNGAPPPEPDYRKPLPEYLEEVESQRIIEALETTRWNRTAAAKLLGVTFRTLRYRLKKLGIE